MIESKERLQEIKDNNFNKVCDFIKDKKEVTIAVIARETGFSLPTVTKIVNYGVALGTFVKSKSDVTTGGRRAKSYRINANYSHTLLLNIDNEEIHWRLIDFRGDESACDFFCYNKNEIVGILDGFIEKCIKECPSLKLCALSLPCVLSNGAVVEWNLNRALNGVNIVEHISDVFGITAICENDMKLLALSSIRYFGDSDSKTISALYLNKVIYGLGSVIDGRILSGKCGFAGEVGYLPVEIKQDDICDTGIKILASAVSLLNPDGIVMYLPGNTGYADCIIEGVKKIIPEYAFPEICVSESFSDDIFSGLMQILYPFSRITGCE